MVFPKLRATVWEVIFHYFLTMPTSEDIVRPTVMIWISVTTTPTNWRHHTTGYQYANYSNN